MTDIEVTRRAQVSPADDRLKRRSGRPAATSECRSRITEQFVELTEETVGMVPVPIRYVVAENVNVFYGDNHAIKECTLEFGKEEVIALIGPSGCGKSTFLRCLNRMNDSIESARVDGKISLDGQDIYSKELDPVALRARVGMVFQKPNPFPKSIYDNVAYGPRIHGLAADRAELDNIVHTSLDRAGLLNEVKDRLDEPGTGLSGGQQQSVCASHEPSRSIRKSS